MSEALTVTTLRDLIREAKRISKRRNFTQSVEIYLVLDSKRVKKEEININEVIELPAKLNKPSKVCVIASGALALNAKKAGADRVIEPDELDSLVTNRREARKIAREYDMFIAEAPLMPRIGRALGQFLGPRGKMPRPVPPSSDITAIIQRLKNSIRVRSRGQLAVSCRIGDEKMKEEDLEKNAKAVIEALERKIPNGRKGIKEIVVKLSMGRPARAKLEEVGL